MDFASWASRKLIFPTVVFNGPLLDNATHPNMATRRLRLGELIHCHVIGFILLESGDAFPGYYGKNNANADNELPFFALHKCTLRRNRGLEPPPT